VPGALVPPRGRQEMVGGRQDMMSR